MIIRTHSRLTYNKLVNAALRDDWRPVWPHPASYTLEAITFNHPSIPMTLSITYMHRQHSTYPWLPKSHRDMILP